MFRNSNIKVFKEFKYFTMQPHTGQQVFARCPNLTEVWLPASITIIDSWFSLGSPNLNTIVMCGKIPPIYTHSSFMYISTAYRYPEGLKIYVPDESLELYCSAWKDLNIQYKDYLDEIVNYIHPMSEYQP